MNGRALLALSACLGLGALLFWGSYRLGRGPTERTPRENENEAKRAPRSGIHGKDPALSRNRLRNAASAQFNPEGSTDPDALRKRFEATANKSLFFNDPETQALLATLKPEDCAAAARAAAALPNANRMSLLKAILARWAMFEPEKAAEFAVNDLSPHEIRNTLAAVFQSWAKRKPEDALAYYEKLESSGRFNPRLGMNSVLGHLFFSWGQVDASAAAKAAQNLVDRGGSYHAWIGIASLAGTEDHREEALNAALGVEEEKARQKALGWVVGNWAAHEPQAAAAWLDENDFDDQGTQWAVAQRFERLDPEANADWLYRRSSPENRDGALSMALNGWARSDIVAACAWLEKVGPTDGGIEIIAQVYTSTDLTKAVEWAKKATAEKRDDVIASTLAQARQFDLKLDLSPYLDAGSLPAEEMKKKVEDLAKQRRRF